MCGLLLSVKKDPFECDVKILVKTAIFLFFLYVVWCFSFNLEYVDFTPLLVMISVSFAYRLLSILLKSCGLCFLLLPC